MKTLFENNRRWAETMADQDPEFFTRLSQGQSPEYLWIGCADSRVPPNQVVGLQPGEVFVHRNVANLVLHTDLSCLTVLQYAVDVLQVKHVLVVGHYGCGGVKAAFEDADNGMLDNWLRNIKDVQHLHQDLLDAQVDDDARINLLIELNVRHQLSHVCQTTIVQNAWARGQSLTVHGCVFDLRDGLLRDLECSVSSVEGVDKAYRIDTGV